VNNRRRSHLIALAAIALLTGLAGLALACSSDEEQPAPSQTASATLRAAATEAPVTESAAPTPTASPAPTPDPTPEPTPPTQPPVQVTQPPAQNCHPSYQGACLDPNASDYDCAGGSGNGPYYTGRVIVVGPDVFDLDRDGDGIGCD
jgi:hypothetical protein